MSFLGKVFGGKKEEKGPDTASVIMNLRETENMLIKKQEYLEKKIDIEINIAKTNRTKNKRAAIQALKRKNRYTKQLQQIDGTLATLEMQREALESANTNTAVLESMKTAADALKKAHKHMDIDQVQNMMDDIGEQQDVAREISEAISNAVAFGQADVDEDDLEQELERLEQEALDEELLKAGPSGVDIPAPIDEPLEKLKGKKVSAKPARKEEDDQDMKNLEMWAS